MDSTLSLIWKVLYLQKNVNIYYSYCTLPYKEDATKRVALSCVPMSGNWFFGPGDVDELLFLLQDSPILSSSQDDGKDDLSEALMARYRPSRVRSMFASRACRKAVMVGDPLTSPQMKKLLNQLSHLQQPWVYAALTNHLLRPII